MVLHPPSMYIIVSIMVGGTVGKNYMVSHMPKDSKRAAELYW